MSLANAGLQSVTVAAASAKAQGISDVMSVEPAVGWALACILLNLQCSLAPLLLCFTHLSALMFHHLSAT